MDAKLNFCGQLYTLEAFANEFSNGDAVQASKVIEVLIGQGRANWVQSTQTAKQDKQLMKALVQQAIGNEADKHDKYDQMQKQYNREVKRENRLTYDEVEFDFAHLGKAEEFEAHVINNMGLESEIALRSGKAVVRVYNLTDQDLNSLSRKYNTEKAINGVVGGVDKVASSATKAVDYTAKQVIAPTVQVGAKAGVSILKTVAVTGFKTAGTLVSAIASGTKQCASEISTDADVLRASRDLLDVKDSAMRAVKSRTGASVGNGIRIK